MASSWRWSGLLTMSFALFAACGDHSVEFPPDSSAGGAGGAGGSGGAGGRGSGGVGGSGVGGEQPLPDPAEPLFSATSIPRFEITLTQETIDSLYAAPDAYVPGDVTVTMDGEVTVLPSVGVRLKGVYGSFRDLGQKAAFLLNFHKFTEGQTLFGLKKLALNNMVQDASMIHERLAYPLFRAMGVPASRSAYATVWVNGSLYGLYTTVEATDNPRFLDHWYGDHEGNVYEGAYGSDLEGGHNDSYDQDNGEDVGFTDLYELTAALDAMTPETFFEEASRVIDLDRYVAFAATELFLGHWDGYAWMRNNYFIARRPDDGRWTFMPWGLDQTFSQDLYPFGGDGRVEQLCAASPPCRRALGQAFERVLAQVSELHLASEAEALRTFIRADMLADPRKEVDPESVDANIDATIDFLNNRPASVRSSLVCVDPSTVDEDDDGASGCGDDCNDHDPTVYSGAPELCNLVDDDCDGILDNDPSCPRCATQPLSTGGTLAFCFVARSWDDAEADCIAQGGHLASIHDQETQDLVASGAFSVVDGDWWIGLTDAPSEGNFEWSDGTPVDYDGWAGGEPNNSGGDENCGHLAAWASGDWNDIQCYHERPYVCVLP